MNGMMLNFKMFFFLQKLFKLAHLTNYIIYKFDVIALVDVKKIKLDLKNVLRIRKIKICSYPSKCRMSDSIITNYIFKYIRHVL